MAYRVNTVIYSLKQFPLIGKIIPDGLYGNDGLKVLGYIISFGYELFSMLAGKIIYIFLEFINSKIHNTNILIILYK